MSPFVRVELVAVTLSPLAVSSLADAELRSASLSCSGMPSTVPAPVVAAS